MSVEAVVYDVQEKEKTYEITLLTCEKVKILMYLDKKSSCKIAIGDCISFVSRLDLFEKSTNVGQFDEYNYYVLQKGYEYKTYVDTYETVKSYKQATWWLKVRNKLCLFRNKIIERLDIIYKGSMNSSNNILRAMLLGDRGTISEEQKEAYSQAGISHVLAISGLHISFLGMAVYNIFLKFKVDKYKASIITVIFLVMYGFMTGFSISTYRAVCMMIFNLFSKFIKRSNDILSSGAISLMIIICYNPYMLCNTALQLSYLAIVGIVVVNKSVDSIFSRKNDVIKNSIKLLIEKNTGNYQDYRWIMSLGDAFTKLVRWIRSSFIGGVCIFVVTLPVILNSFYEVKILSLVVNIVAIPLMSIVVIMSILSLIMSYVCMPLAYMCGGSAQFILICYECIGKACEKVSFNNVILGHMSIVEVIIYYMVLIVCVYVMKKKCIVGANANSELWCINKNKKIFCYITVASLMLVVILGRMKINDDMEIYMLDVSQGDGMVLITPDNKVILVDGGSSDEEELYKYRLEPFLKYKGISKIDYVMISHMDMDHISGILDLLEDGEIIVHNIILTLATYDGYKEFLEVVKGLNINVSFIKAGDILKIKDVIIKFLHPSYDYKGSSKNAYSMTFLLNYQRFDMLFTGDLEEDGERIICKKLKDYVLNNKIDVIKVSHHGSKNSSTEEFVKLIKPNYALISAGKNNRYGHPHRETIEKFKDVGSDIYSTNDVGMVRLVSNGISIKVSIGK